MERYQALYASSAYAPAEVQARVTALVRSAISRHRGTSVSFVTSPARTPARRATTAADRSAEQLGLGL